MNIRTLIVDDEVLARRSLASLLELEPDFVVIGECADGRSALRTIESAQPDLVFLDIQMPQLDGFGLLDGLYRGRQPLIVFVTAHDQFAIKAFEAQALDYLLKPFRRDRFQAALERVRRSVAARDAMSAQNRESAAAPHSMAVRSRDRVVFVRFDRLELVRAAANYVHLHVGDTMYEVRERIAVMEERLPADRFLRIHRSYIVNLDRVAKIEPYTKDTRIAILANGAQIPISRAGYLRLKELMDRG
jgi:two-component system, LytTR family, response regulator